MSGFIEGENRYQSTLFPERVDDYVEEDSVVRVIDVFIDRLDISGLGFKAEAAETGRPGYHSRTMLKIYVYGYLNQVHSSRRLEREAGRNVELMWLSGRLAPDFKTIADFRKDNGEAINPVARNFALQQVNRVVILEVVEKSPPFRQALNNFFYQFFFHCHHLLFLTAAYPKHPAPGTPLTLDAHQITHH